MRRPPNRKLLVAAALILAAAGTSFYRSPVAAPSAATASLAKPFGGL
jgi:hypothetical protein